jgi:hypothetical protein
MGGRIRTAYGFVRSAFENHSILSNDTNGDSCERKTFFYLLNQAVIFFTAGVFQEKSNNVIEADFTFHEAGVFETRIEEGFGLGPFPSIVERYPVRQRSQDIGLICDSGIVDVRWHELGCE